MANAKLIVVHGMGQHDDASVRQFSTPPTVQWIVLHPNIVAENVAASAGGEKVKEALMIELAGANWWKQEQWYLPTGGSITGVYADRADVSESGYGVALHFRSVYSIALQSTTTMESSFHSTC
jgi:hypothetical protein